MFLTIVEIAIGLLVIAFLITQVMVPLWKNLPLFPFFRKEAKLDVKQSEADEQVRIFKKEERIDKTLERAGIRRNQPDSDDESKS